MGDERRSRDDWVAAGLTHLGEVGVDKVRVDRIAVSLGVTKGSFYWHFADRGELLAAMVDRWESRYTDELISQVDGSGSDAKERGHRLWRLTAGDPVIRAELAIRDWARRDDSIASRVQQVDDRRLRYVESLLVDLGIPQTEVPARSLLVYALLFSNYLITTTQPKLKRRAIVADALELLLRPS